MVKVLIGLIEHFGDIVACEPVARYLRAKYPQAHLSWAVRKIHRELIDSNPYIDETIVMDCLTDWIKLSNHAAALENAIVVDLHVNYRVCECCRVPLIKQNGNPFVNAYEWLDYGALLEAFSQGAGLPKLSAQPHVYLTDEHKAAVDALGLPERFCVVHRESTMGGKAWPDAHWLRLVQLIASELKLPVVEIGASSSRDGASHQPLGLKAKEPNVIELINRTGLLQTAEVIRRARLYVGIDSGPAHLANAVKTPGVILLGRLDVFRKYNPFTGSYAEGSPNVRLVRNLSGPVTELPFEEVAEAVRYQERLAGERGREGTFALTTAGGAKQAAMDTHYRDLVVSSGFFDSHWYATYYPEVLPSGIDPLEYFVTRGGAAGHSPGPLFDSYWYKTQRGDLGGVDDALKHYCYFGRQEGLRPSAGPVSATAFRVPELSQISATLDDISAGVSAAARRSLAKAPEDVDLPRIFAFYLPQFHPIDETNYGHGPGFTEWTNVIKAKPLFDGHYQPRLPGELGYYDLRSIDVMREQTKLAQNHGIDGFCFYYYYFQGKRLLYKPIENYIQSDIDAPFLFLWANENWTRRWDGGDNEVIVSQAHSREDDLLFIRELFATFADRRYVKIDGKPVLGVYKAHLFPNVKASTDLWRTEAERYGFAGLYLITVDDWTSDPPHPRHLGFDATYEIPSNIVHPEVLWEGKPAGLVDGFEGRLVDYRKFASFHMGRPFPDYKRFRTVMAPWDNTPRYASRALVHVNTENDAYQRWLSEALFDTQRRYRGDERLVFLHSWNEWCEGTYVEPDGRYGRRYLEETRAAVDELKAALRSGGDPATHLYFQRLAAAKDEGASRVIQAVRKQHMYMAQEIDRQRDQLHQQRLKIEALEGELSHQAGYREALDQVYRSKSWQITKPLRAVTQRFQKS